MAVGFRCEVQDHFGGVDGGVDVRPALADALIEHAMVEIAEELHLVLRIPVETLAAVALLVEQWPERRELLVEVGR